MVKCLYLPLVVDVEPGWEAKWVTNLPLSQQLQHLTEAPPLLHHLRSVVGED